MSKDVLYGYAYDEILQKRVSINKITPQIRETHSFRCINCGRPMKAALGENNRHYFSHKNAEDCNNESYLHKLGKEELKDWFEKHQFNFTLGFKQKMVCKEKCKMFNEKECSTKNTVLLNMQNMNYSTCSIEQYITNDKGEQFKADLLLESPNENVKPLLIEICIKHPCEKKKINSGLQIIEIWFRSEKDIENFCKKGEFIESESVRFYNIDNTPKRKIKSTEILDSKYVMRFICKANGTWDIYDELLPCSQMYTKIEKDSEIELNYLNIGQKVKLENAFKQQILIIIIL